MKHTVFKGRENTMQSESNGGLQNQGDFPRVSLIETL